jgi:alpha,alpha-trehalase
LTTLPALAQPHALRAYALIADGERGALVGPGGDLAWMCFPRWHDDAILSGLLGGPGGYVVCPASRNVWGGNYDHGLIWRSRWVAQDGIVESRDALALPGALHRAVVLRRVRAVEGPVRVRVELDLHASFGRRAMEDVRRDEEGVWRARAGDVHIAWSGAPDATTRDDGGSVALTLELDLDHGEVRDLVLVLDAHEPSAVPGAEEAWTATEAAWRERAPDLTGTLGGRDTALAYAVLSGLTSATGGAVAATTTSLPERAGAGRSYDYRYAWIRDQCYAGIAVARAGALPVLTDAVRFVVDRVLDDGPQLAPAYTIDGDRVPAERELELPGYPGGAAKTGNRAGAQFQLDAFGEVLLLLAHAARLDVLDADGWRAVERATAAIEERWNEPDSGVWEIEPRRWTQSRLSCVSGLRAISAHGPGGEPMQRRLALADRIVAACASEAVHPSGRWQRASDDDRVDASLLLAAVRGAIPADDPRTLATLRAVEEELVVHGYCYRFRPDARSLGEAEGAFLLCSYWLALAYHQQGDRLSAARSFEAARHACGSPGLYAEEFDVAQRQLRGNLPQMFVHALMLEAALAGAA